MDDLVARLRAVAARQSSYAQRYELMHDSRAIFIETCSRMTELIADELPKRTWTDPEWIVELSEAFGRHLFHAHDRNDEGRLEPCAWLVAFDLMDRRGTSVLGALIAGMACHIMHDLPLCLSETQFQGRPDRIRDYQLMNDVLCDAIDEIFDRVARRYNPILHWSEKLGKRSEDLMVGYGIRIARRAAWYDACRLQALHHDDALAALEENTTIFMQSVFRPPFWSARALVAAFRWITAHGRRWPKHRVAIAVSPPQEKANRHHYFHLGIGDWRGTFGFRLTDARAFWRERLGWKTRLLVLGLAALRRAKIEAWVRGFDEQGEGGVAYSFIRISRFGLPLFALHETHTLAADGTNVFVTSVERLGMRPFSVRSERRYAARVEPAGVRTLSFVPLLCKGWESTDLAPAGGRVESRLTCGWAEAEEHVERVAP
jgi:hypothetical protein